MVVGNTGYALEQALEEPLTTHVDQPLILRGLPHSYVELPLLGPFHNWIVGSVLLTWQHTISYHMIMPFQSGNGFHFAIP
jgi:hypothetical protein